MNPLNDSFRDLLGVTRFHKAGYTGKRGLSASGEDFITLPNAHAGTTYKVFKEIAPDREVIYLPTGGVFGSVATSDFINKAIPDVIKRKVDVMWTSCKYPENGTIYDEPLKPTLPYFTYFMSTGNNSTEEYNKVLESQYIYGVGACYLMPDGKLYPTAYSSVTDETDFCAPAMLWIDGSPFDGTSCSAPVLAGMAALVNDFFIDKTGNPLSNAMMYQFMKDHCKDVGDTGKDNVCGWGNPILPDPATIDIEKYGGDSVVITMKIGSTSMTVDGVVKTLDQAPIMDNKTFRTLVPLRAISEALGCAVDWNQSTQTITITR